MYQQCAHSNIWRRRIPIINFTYSDNKPEIQVNISLECLNGGTLYLIQEWFQWSKATKINVIDSSTYIYNYMNKFGKRTIWSGEFRRLMLLEIKNKHAGLYRSYNQTMWNLPIKHTHKHWIINTINVVNNQVNDCKLLAN